MITPEGLILGKYGSRLVITYLPSLANYSRYPILTNIIAKLVSEYQLDGEQWLPNICQLVTL